jgi:hypothetical protein
LLNDRPPLVLRATIAQPTGPVPLQVTVIVNHLRSLSGVDGTDGNRIRVKRQKQAESLANLIQSFQTSNPAANIISVGDYNAFQFNDGYVDSIGTIKGTPAPSDQVVQASPDLVNPNLNDVAATLPANQHYSYSFDGNAQTLDHALVNPNLFQRLTRFAYARMDADFPESYRNDPNRPERISDHDPEVAYFTLTPAAPTAAGSTISGQVRDALGQPLAGVVLSLSGAKSARAMTDAQGNYRFENLESNNFYTVAPARANYAFAPSERSFSLNADKTDAIFTASAIAQPVANPLDTDMFFVRQQYLDFLGREPDNGGLQYWTSELDKCADDANCLNQRRIGVAAAFFIEQEYQHTGSFVYRLYQGALGRHLSYAEFSADRQQVSGGPALDQSQATFAAAFVQRAEFMQKYQGQTSAGSFVDALLLNMKQASGVDLSSQRSSLMERYKAGGNINESRALALREAVESSGFKEAEYNASFVLMEYYGYLKREPEVEGYQFWLNVLKNKEPGNYRGMVCSFITSAEYQQRFSSVVTHNNQECR